MGAQNPFQRVSLATITWLLILIAFGGVVLLTSLFIRQDYERAQRQLLEEKKKLAETIESVLFSPLADIFIIEMAKLSEVEFVHIVHPSGAIIASSISGARGKDISSFVPNKPLEYEAPVFYDTEFEGRQITALFFPTEARNLIVVGFFLDDLKREIASLVVRNVLIGFSMFMFAGGMIMLMFWRVLRPLQRVEIALKKVGSGNLEFVLPIKNLLGRELVSLFNGFNTMVSRLKEIHDREIAVSQSKTEFVSIVAHQLRTPLSALKWVLNLALEEDFGKLKKKQRELLGKGYDTNERMIILVNDLLDIVHIEEGRFDYKLEKGAVTEIIENIVKEIEAIAEQKGVQLFFHRPSPKLPEVVLDATKFRLAVANIIDNAVQYTPPNGRVDIEFSLNGNEILVSVKDTGIGIASRQLSRVFTKFFRADNAVRTQTVGSGLGLFIAKNIIEKHGGKIWIESQEGKGTTVYFTNPVARP